MFLRVKNLHLKLLILFCWILSVFGECYIDLPSDPAITPSFSVYVGSHKLKLNANIYSNSVLKLHELQELEADCDINFEEPAGYQMSNKIYIKCEQNYVYISIDKQHKQLNDYYRRPALHCSLLSWNLYESFTNFDWCPSNVTSFILARPDFLMPPFYNYLAGICYDIYNNSFKSVFYTMSPNKIENQQPQALRDFYAPAVKLDYISEIFGSNSLPNDAFGDVGAMIWITNFKYHFNTIIPPEQLYITYNDKFSTLIEFVWWSNLRLYNWRRYKFALEKHVEKDNETYDILAGVSGAVKVPIPTPCQTNYTMKEVVFDTNRKIPLYVWNYLQSRSNSSNAVVVIGFNSPFNEFYAQHDIALCADRCQEIAWLKEASTTFQYKVMGFIICCSVEEVRSSNILHGFPEIDINRQSVATTTQLPTAYDDESTEINYNENNV